VEGGIAASHLLQQTEKQSFSANKAAKPQLLDLQKMSLITKIRAIDSHTGGEPTRVVIDGFPDLGSGSMAERLEKFRECYDSLRSAIVCEPRGHAAVVGALLCEPVNAACAAGVIFFNNVGYLGMCGHGTIGLMKTLEYTGRISAGKHVIETPVGNVEAELNADGTVTITNVPSYRFAKDVQVSGPDFGVITGDIAWGGNWFYLISDHSQIIELSNLKRLTEYCVAVRNALEANGITGSDDAEIDHIELFSPTPTADSRNFVLCPGLEYDRSPCGTGTSAKLACLFADGKLKEGEIWRQESIVGSIFEGSVRPKADQLIPIIRGSAWVTSEIELIFDDSDPYRFGIAAR
jgi:4-hydroxyproline epimerase